MKIKPVYTSNSGNPSTASEVGDAKRPMTEIEIRMDSLDFSTKQLSGSIDRLRSKLQPSLTIEHPPAQYGDEVQEEPERCELSKQILTQEQFIRNSTAEIERLIERCQL